MALTQIQIGDTGTQAKNKINAAFAQVDTNTADIGVINGAISDLNNDIITTQNDITNVQGDITNIQGYITNMQGDITNMQGYITNVQGDITTLQNDMSVTQSDVNDVESAIDNIYDYEELDNVSNVTLTFENLKNKRFYKKISSHQTITVDVTDGTMNGTIEVLMVAGSVYVAQTGAGSAYGFDRQINGVGMLRFVLMDGYLTYSFTSFENSTTPDLSFVHSTLSVVGNAATFAPAYPREYVDMEITDNTALTVDIQGVNEHYILVHNTTGIAKTVAINGANSETIIGDSAISVTTYYEISIIKHNGELVITARAL